MNLAQLLERLRLSTHPAGAGHFVCHYYCCCRDMFGVVAVTVGVVAVTTTVATGCTFTVNNIIGDEVVFIYRPPQ